MKYLLSQVLIFFSVFVTLFLIDINYNGVAWEYSLAYGSLIPLALWRFRKDRATLYCLLAVAGCWLAGRTVELSADPGDMSHWITFVGILCLVCVYCERYRLLVVSLALLAYSLRLSIIEANYLQQGLLNLIFAALFFVQLTVKDSPRVSRAEQDRQELKEAA